jgi:C_GCAxxG_C_C family probable redox protein
MGLEAKGDINIELVQAMAGLAKGCGNGTATCGALTGGCCLLSLCVGKGNDQKLPRILQELTDWFWEAYGYRYGGIDCNSIRDAREVIFEPAQHRCGEIVINVYLKAICILRAVGVNLDSKYSFTEYYNN